MLGNKYIAAAVGVLLVIVISYNVKFFASRETPSTQPALQTERLQRIQPNEKVEIPERTIMTRDSAMWRDPFYVDLHVSKKRFRLAGIIHRDGTSLALINGKTYGVNDKIDNAVIRDIRNRSVVVAVDGTLKEVFIDDHNPSEVKTK
jgi:type II secretory pathway component PulC